MLIRIAANIYENLHLVAHKELQLLLLLLATITGAATAAIDAIAWLEKYIVNRNIS